MGRVQKTNKIIKSKEAVYSLTSGLNQNIMNKLTDQILNNLPNFNEWIETSILKKYKFKGWNEVVKNLHSPRDDNIKNKKENPHEKLMFEIINFTC